MQLYEVEGKELLREAGFTVPEGRLVRAPGRRARPRSRSASRSRSRRSGSKGDAAKPGS